MSFIPQSRSGCWIPFGPDTIPSYLNTGYGFEELAPSTLRRLRKAGGNPPQPPPSTHFCSAATNGTDASRYLRKTLLYRDMPWDVSLYDVGVYPAPFGGPIAAYARGSNVIEIYTAAGRYMTEVPIPSQLTNPNLGQGAGAYLCASAASARLQSRAAIVTMGWDAEETLMVLTDTCQVYFYRLGMTTAGCATACLNHLNDRLSAPPNAYGNVGGGGGRHGDDGSSPFLLVGCDTPPVSLLEGDKEPFDICFASIGPWGVIVQDQDRRLRGVYVAERKAPRYFMADLNDYVDEDVTAIDVLPTDDGFNELVFVVAPGRGDKQPQRVLKKRKQINTVDDEVSGTLMLVRIEISAPIEEEIGAGGDLIVRPPPHDVTVLNLHIPSGVAQVRCDRSGAKIALYTFDGEVVVMSSTLNKVLFRYSVGIPLRPSPFLWVGPDVLLLQFSMCDFEFGSGGGDGDAGDEYDNGGGGDYYDDGPTDDVTFLLCVNKKTHELTNQLTMSLGNVAQNQTIITTAVGGANGTGGASPAGRNGRLQSLSPNNLPIRRRPHADSNAMLDPVDELEERQRLGRECGHKFGFPQLAERNHVFHYIRWENEGGLCKVVAETDGVRFITERNTYLLEWVPQCVVEVQKPPSVATLLGAVGQGHHESKSLTQFLISSNVGGAADGGLSTTAGALVAGAAAAAAAAGGGANGDASSLASELSTLALPAQFLPLPAQLVQLYHMYVVEGNVEGLTMAKALVAGLKTEERYAELLGTILNAALYEWDVDVQERLMRVVSFAMAECTVGFANRHSASSSQAHHQHGADQDDDADAPINFHKDYLEKAKLLRMLNALRHTDCGIPLSVRQLEELTGSEAYANNVKSQVIVDRLVNRHDFQIAIALANEARIKTHAIYVKWSCVKVLAAAEEGVPDAEIRQQLTKVMKNAPGATLTDTAMTAFRARRTQLAVHLLDDDPKPHSKVMLFMRINSDIIALERACEANDSDLVFLVLLKMLVSAQKKQAAQQVTMSAQYNNYAGPTNGYYVNVDYEGGMMMHSNNSFDNAGGGGGGSADNSAYDMVINALSLRGGVPLLILTLLSRGVGKWEGLVAKHKRDQGRACWAGYRMLHRLMTGDDDVYYSGSQPMATGASAASDQRSVSPAMSEQRQSESDADDAVSMPPPTASDTEEEDVDEDSLTEEEREKRMEAALAKRKRQLERKKRAAEAAEKKKSKKDKKKADAPPPPPPPPKVEPTGVVALPVGAYDYLTTDQVASVIVRLNTVPSSAQAASDANYLRLHNALIMEQEAIAREYGDAMNISYEEDLCSLSVLGTIAFCLEKGLEQRATELKAKFNIKEASYWHTKVRALVRAHRFNELDAFGRAHDPKFTKSPIGWLPFIDALYAVGGQEDRMVHYIDKLPTTVAKVTWFASIKRYGKAADAAAKDEEIGMLEQLLTYTDMDRSVRDYIQGYIKDLS